MNKSTVEAEIRRQIDALRAEQRVPRTIELADDPFRAMGYDDGREAVLRVEMNEDMRAFDRALIGEFEFNVVRTGPGEGIRVTDA